MSDITLYHYARCSKSRAALALLEERGIQAQIIHYIDTPPTSEQLTTLLSQLGLTARQLMRTGESVYSELQLENSALSEAQLINAMVQAPILIERPILVVGQRAAIGRPIDNLIEILP
ncbi:MAG: arsenate reductase (glutaredoxin) [Gammaproteobacteria bacterium]|nr:arsenate reductase (glutaredoxin) [Gammaproteobacteria bacterium]